MDTQTSLTKARIQLLLDMCFYGNLALHLKLVENNTIPSFATDGKHIFYNKKFADSLKDNEKQWILAHEISHNIFLHLSRRQNRHQLRWNLAIDYACNSILYKEFGFIPEGGLYDSKFENMTAEEIYNKLPEMNGKGQKNGKYKKYEKGEGDDKITVEISKEGIKVDGKKIKNYDEHKDIEGSKEEIDDLEKEWKIQTIKSYHQSKIAGKLPAGMNIFIKELLQPKLNWREMMKQFVVSIAKSDFRWLPPNRKFIHRDMYMPSLTSESLGDVVIIVDNSGSTIEHQQQFFSECNGLLQQYDINLHLIVCDCEINDYSVYHKGESIKKEYKGGGGSNLKPAFKLIEKKWINPTVCIILSDGYIDVPEKTPRFPVLWVLTKDSVELDKISFGQKVKIE